MPFTVSHILAVLPVKHLLKKRIDFVALVIGAMIPDLAFFLPFSLGRDFSHSLPGVFLFCFPSGIILCTTFYLFFRLPLVELSFGFIKRRLKPELEGPSFFSGRNAFLTLSGLSIGMAGHLFWDSFTHGDGFMVNLLPVLKTEILLTENKVLPFYQFLQDFSSITALVLLGVYMLIWLWFTKNFNYYHSVLLPKKMIILFRFIIFLLPLIGAFLLAIITAGGRGLLFFLNQLALWLVFTGGKIFLFLLFGYCLFWWLFKIVTSKKTI